MAGVDCYTHAVQTLDLAPLWVRFAAFQYEASTTILALHNVVIAHFHPNEGMAKRAVIAVTRHFVRIDDYRFWGHWIWAVGHGMRLRNSSFK